MERCRIDSHIKNNSIIQQKYIDKTDKIKYNKAIKQRERKINKQEKET